MLFDSDEPLFSVAAPQFRRVIFDVTLIQRVAETVDEALLVAMEDDVDGSDPLTIVYTSGTTTCTQGHVAHPCRATGPSATPQRGPKAQRGGQAVLQFAVLLDRRIRFRIAGHHDCRRIAGVLDRGRRRPDPGSARVRKADYHQWFRGGDHESDPAPELRRPASDVDATGESLSDHGPRGDGRPTPSCDTTCSG